MTLTEAASAIANGPKWSLVMLYEDGEFGVVDASTEIAEHLMRTCAAFVVGIYLSYQWRYLDHDLMRQQRLAA